MLVSFHPKLSDGSRGASVVVGDKNIADMNILVPSVEKGGSSPVLSKLQPIIRNFSGRDVRIIVSLQNNTGNSTTYDIRSPKAMEWELTPEGKFLRHLIVHTSDGRDEKINLGQHATCVKFQLLAPETMAESRRRLQAGLVKIKLKPGQIISFKADSPVDFVAKLNDFLKNLPHNCTLRIEGLKDSQGVDLSKLIRGARAAIQGLNFPRQIWIEKEDRCRIEPEFGREYKCVVES